VACLSQPTWESTCQIGHVYVTLGQGLPPTVWPDLTKSFFGFPEVGPFDQLADYEIGSKPEGSLQAAPGAVPDTSEVGAHSAHHRRGRPTVTRKSVQGPALGTPYLLIPVGPLGVIGGPSGGFHRDREVPAHPQVLPVTAEGLSWTF
jgi:hypothetical protein